MKARVKRSTLGDIAMASRNTYPKEFLALLGSTKKNGIIDEFVLMPATYGDTFSSMQLHLVPFDKGILGSVHSHPGPSAMPSSADKKFFKKTGEIHLIISLPFSIDSIRAFNAEGKEIEMEVLE